MNDIQYMVSVLLFLNNWVEKKWLAIKLCSTFCLDFFYFMYMATVLYSISVYIFAVFALRARVKLLAWSAQFICMAMFVSLQFIFNFKSIDSIARLVCRCCLSRVCCCATIYSSLFLSPLIRLPIELNVIIFRLADEQYISADYTYTFLYVLSNFKANR